MNSTMRYVNSRGEVISFAPESKFHYVDTNTRNFMKPYNTVNGMFAGFYDDLTEFTMDAVVKGNTLDDKNRIFEVMEYDVLHESMGRLYAGDYYTECFRIGSEKADWHQVDEYMRDKLTFLSRTGIWMKETQYNYAYSENASGEVLDFDYDFDHDLGYTAESHIIDGGSFGADALIRIYGPCVNPSVTIGGNSYGANVSLAYGDRLEINTIEKTVNVFNIIGESTNAFSKRQGVYKENSGSYIFQKIPSGLCNVTWSGEFDFDVVVKERRNEPAWN